MKIKYILTIIILELFVIIETMFFVNLGKIFTDWQFVFGQFSIITASIVSVFISKTVVDDMWNGR